jgi:glycosyltransferase involved in cell wall biosynthesis
MEHPVQPSPHRILVAFPGGFEFGGIGRIMLYAMRALDGLPGAPRLAPLDARGTGSIVWMPWHLLAAIAKVARERPDLLHLNVAGRTSTLRKILLSETAALLHVPTVLHLHDYDYRQDFARRSPLVARITRRMFRRARRVIVLGRRDEATVAELLGVPAERIVCLPNAVPDPGEPPVRGTTKGPVRLLFLGHLDDRKGVPELLAALARPEFRAANWQLDLAGAGQVPRFQAMAVELGLSERLRFHGWLGHAETYALSRSADIFVLPSHAEGQAMSLIEAMAHGLAIVATPVGAHLEAVKPDRDALLVPPGDVPSLAKALATLIQEPQRRLELGAAARRRYLAGFTVDGYARRLWAIHQAVLPWPKRARTPRPIRTISPLKG